VLFNLILFILFPIFLITVIFIFFLIYWKTFEESGFGKRELGLLVAGSASTMFFNLPLFLYRNYFLALNVGGALIPLILSFYFISKNSYPFMKIVFSISLVSIATYMVTFVTNEGVVAYFPFYFLPSILAFLLSLLLYFRQPKAAPFSYTISTLGVMIGGDLAHFPEIFSSPFMGSMGGAGIYDMVYLAGLISFCLSFLFVEKKRVSYRERVLKRLQENAYLAGEVAGIGGDYRHIIKKITGKNIEEIKERKEIRKIMKEMNKRINIYGDPVKRIMAFLVDSLILMPIILLFLFLLDFRIYILLSFPLLIQFVYFLLLEYFFGSTVGKGLFDLEVRNLVNKRADLMTIFTRNIFRIMEFFLLFYAFSIVLMVLSTKKQRIGDIIANSIVVEVK